MIKLALIALSSALVATSPATAEGARAAEPAVVASAAMATVASVDLPRAKPVATTRYCIVDTVTGSRIERKMCRTRSQWLDQGFDPLAAK